MNKVYHSIVQKSMTNVNEKQFINIHSISNVGKAKTQKQRQQDSPFNTKVRRVATQRCFVVACQNIFVTIGNVRAQKFKKKLQLFV